MVYTTNSISVMPVFLSASGLFRELKIGFQIGNLKIMRREFLVAVDRNKKNVSMYSALVAFNLYLLGFIIANPRIFYCPYSLKILGSKE